ncbi:hypothetical protein M885DRAFT_551276 [Pelagophyceae sp. CCMP2097]|nr:hypothetical protein M885DRAFT_551276 [Pelagophyceae sp. CCMP2097]
MERKKPNSIVDRVTAVRLLALCPTMDLVAVVGASGGLAVHRTTSWQKLMAPTELSVQGAIAALAWAPDGRSLATGHACGGVLVLDVESEAVDARCSENGLCAHSTRHTASITCMAWRQQHATLQRDDDDAAYSLMAGYLDRSRSFLHDPSAATAGLEDVIDSENAREESALTLLVTCDAAGAVVLWLYGLFPIARLETFATPNPPIPRGACASADLGTLVVWARHDDGADKEVILTYGVESMWRRRRELAPCAKAFLACGALVQMCQTTVDAVRACWADALKPLDLKLERLGDEAQVAQEFLGLMMHGDVSSTLSRFITDHFSEAAVTKLQRSINAAATDAEALLADRVLRAARLLLFRSSELAALARARCSFSKTGAIAGVEASTALHFVDDCERLVLSAERALATLRHARRRLALLLTWFRGIVASVSGTSKDKPRSQHVVREIVTFLQQASLRGAQKAAPSGRGAEALVGASLLAELQAPAEGQVAAPSPSRAARMRDGDSDDSDSDEYGSDAGLAPALQSVVRRCDGIFAAARADFTSSIAKRTTLRLARSETAVALHARASQQSASTVLVAFLADSRLARIIERGAHDVLRVFDVDVPIGLTVSRIDFYARPESERLALLLASQSAQDEVWLVDDASASGGAATSVDVSDEARESGEAHLQTLRLPSTAPISAGHCAVLELKRGSSQALHVSGQRGVALVMASPNYLTIYDVEDIDDDDDDDDPDDDMT